MRVPRLIISTIACVVVLLLLSGVLLPALGGNGIQCVRGDAAALVYTDLGVHFIDPSTLESRPDAVHLANAQILVIDSRLSNWLSTHRRRRFRLWASELPTDAAGALFAGAADTAQSLAPDYFAATPIGQIEGYDSTRLATGGYACEIPRPIGYVLRGFVGFGGLAVVLVWYRMFARAHRADELERRARDASRCASCDYDFAGLQSDRCPECGHKRSAAV